MKLQPIKWVLLLWATLLLWQGAVVFAASPVLLRIGTHLVPTADEWLDVPIYIDIPEDTVVQTAHVKISYDSTLFQVVGCFSDFLNAACQSDLAGEVQLRATAAVGVSGNYQVGNIRFLAKAAQGSTVLLLEAIEVTDKQAQPLVVQTQPGLLCIGSCPDPARARQQQLTRLSVGQWASLLVVPILGLCVWWWVRRRMKRTR